MESRENLFKQYKKDWPQTVGETDKVFDNDNFIDWLCQRTKALTDEIDKLQSRISELEKANICPNCDGIINNEYHPYCCITFKQPTEKQSKEVYSDNPRYPLFKHLSDEYSLLLLDSELDEIINIAKQVDGEIEAVDIDLIWTDVCISIVNRENKQVPFIETLKYLKSKYTIKRNI